MWRRFKILVGLLIVFLAGAAVGGVIVVRAVHKKVLEKTDATRWEPATMTWLRKEVSLTADQETKVQPLVHETVEQMKYLRDVAGIDHVAIGSDFEGDIHPPDELRDASRFPALALALAQAGLDASDVRKIFAENALRVLCGKGLD